MTCANKYPTSSLLTWHKTIACVSIRWARSHLLRARERGIPRAHLARRRAPLPLCVVTQSQKSSARHGGGFSAGLALLPSFFLELWGDSGWTHILPQVNMTLGPRAADTHWLFATYFCLFVFFRLLFSPFPWFSPTNSEEAKSTTWLHPVTGEAVVTGHRKTPGKHPSHVHTQRMRGVIGASRWKKKKGGRQLAWRKESFLLPAAEQQPPLLRSPASLPPGDYHARRPPSSPLVVLHLDTLRHTF